MKALGFRIERVPYHPSSGLTGEMVQKVRDDGRVGPAVGDEALLWDHLKAASSDLDEMREKNAHLAAALRDETTARLDAEKERDDLRRQLERKGKR